MRSRRLFAALLIASVGLTAGACGVGTSHRTIAVRAEPVLPDVTPTHSTTEWAKDNESTLVANRLYRSGKVGTVTCRLPSTALTTERALVRYAQTVVSCLNKAWRPVVDRSANYFTPPKVYAVEVGDETDCGEVEDDDLAFYCPGDSAVYFAWDEFVVEDPEDQMPVEIAMVQMVAHEYGHHLQQLVGIMGYFENRYDEAEGEAQLRESRRLELQADCFGAAFLGANRKALRLTGERYEELLYYFTTGDEEGDVRDHGSGASHEYWSTAAYRATSPGVCNTWSAPAGRVS